ncbi:MAG: NADP-dependent oxidoreductase [Candidatus Hodarchaeota archaeon]
MNEIVNRNWRLASYPVGLIKESDFEWVKEKSIIELKEGEILIRNLYLSLDPSNRNWINPARAPHYTKPIKIGEVMRGICLGRIEQSRNSKFEKGEIVTGIFGWQDYTISDGSGVISISLFRSEDVSLTAYLHIFGMIGITAYFGLLEIGKPREGETLVISAAAGSVGSLVGQIGKIKGCRVIGIAGTKEKCNWIKTELGYDGAINYKTESVDERLRELCPDGVDIYYDNVGGEILDTVLKHINLHARIVICGMISLYNVTDKPAGLQNYTQIHRKRALVQGFNVNDYLKRMTEAFVDLMQWFSEGKLKYREDIIEGLENAPRAINKLFYGSNKGKLLIKIIEESIL